MSEDTAAVTSTTEEMEGMVMVGGTTDHSGNYSADTTKE